MHGHATQLDCSRVQWYRPERIAERTARSLATVLQGLFGLLAPATLQRPAVKVKSEISSSRGRLSMAADAVNSHKLMLYTSHTPSQKQAEQAQRIVTNAGLILIKGIQVPIFHNLCRLHQERNDAWLLRGNHMLGNPRLHRHPPSAQEPIVRSNGGPKVHAATAGAGYICTSTHPQSATEQNQQRNHVLSTAA